MGAIGGGRPDENEGVIHPSSSDASQRSASGQVRVPYVAQDDPTDGDGGAMVEAGRCRRVGAIKVSPSELNAPEQRRGGGVGPPKRRSGLGPSRRSREREAMSGLTSGWPASPSTTPASGVNAVTMEGKASSPGT